MLLSAIGYGYVQKGRSGATFLAGRSLLLCDHELLSHYWFLLDYVSLIRDQIQHLFANFIKPLSYSSRLLQSKGSTPGDSYTFKDQLKSYRSQYELTTKPLLFRKYELLKKTGDNALAQLDVVTGTFSEPSDVGPEAYFNVHKYLDDFRRCHEKISDAGGDLGMIAAEIDKLEQTASRVLGYTSALTKALIELLKPQEN